jgi:hypothetical protein
MEREDGSVTGGGGMQRSGPTTGEAKIIRQMVAQGATVKDLRKRFPDIDSGALARWHGSVEVAGKAAVEDPEDEGDETGGELGGSGTDGAPAPPKPGKPPKPPKAAKKG